MSASSNDAFWATVVRAIDGDSILVRRAADNALERVRVGGIDVPSRGPDAEAARRLIDAHWRGRRVRVRATADYRVHGELPAIVVDAQGHNLGAELLPYGVRLARFPIAALPFLPLNPLNPRLGGGGGGGHALARRQGAHRARTERAFGPRFCHAGARRDFAAGAAPEPNRAA